MQIDFWIFSFLRRRMWEDFLRVSSRIVTLQFNFIGCAGKTYKVRAMKVPTVDKFCCVFDLSLGGLILGYLGVISNASYVILLMFDLLFDTETLKQQFGKIFTGAGNNETISDGSESLSTNGENQENLRVESSWKFLVLDFLMLVLLLIAIFATCFFISLWFIEGVNEVRLFNLK